MRRDQSVYTDTEPQTFAGAYKAEALRARVTLGELARALSESREHHDRTAGRLAGLAGAERGPRALRIKAWAEECREHGAERALVAVGIKRGVGF